MYRHRKSHLMHQSIDTVFSFSYECGYSCIQEPNKKVLIRHIKHHLNQNSKPRKKPVLGFQSKCPKCDDHLINYRKFEHLDQIHKIDIEEQYLKFQNETEFLTWKLNVGEGNSNPVLHYTWYL